MRKIVKLSVALLATSVMSLSFATGEGFYTGIGVGTSKIQSEKVTFVTNGNPPTVTVSPSNTGFGAHLYWGYNIFQWGGFEMGYTHFGSSTYKVPESVSCGSPAVRQYAIDFVGRGNIPVGPVSAFGKAGIAVVRATKSGSLVAQTTTSTPCGSNGENNNTTSARPTFSIGAAYDFNPNWQVDMTFMRIMKGSNVATSDLLSLGFSYHIADKLCGQFLC